ncbi:hypothetical protein HG535_0C05940 [Zygotorulaspora mrakii]|uniref:Origin recognition complex subunit 4 C-terminal domain-containing protein n=1 Tax=Zygotorulaspora mrakii TaxID=42260 RepID=A0A7H9B0T6_ZYGMR|nr:uncharacterized protein HG535_0C05940 [Zygotorulaspora mrakii]QLG72240.1 hypothetical protein HG535_0C05940 [Zygotorulaspora mrakii]
MEQVDAEFDPIRKAKIKVTHDRIIKDAMIDHEQSTILKRIALLPVKKAVPESDATKDLEPVETSDDADENETTGSKRTNKDILQNIRLITKRSKISDNESVATSNIVRPLDTDFRRFKHHLLRQLYHNLPPEQTKVFTYLQGVQQEIERILKQAITQKESHSSMLVGPRGSYKTFLLNHELDLLSARYHRQYITIRLNGFIHSEQTAINGIATQLEEQLKILSKDFKDSSKKTDISSGSLTEVFEKILRLLDSTFMGNNKLNDEKKNVKNKITVIFIFDEIDQFAGPVRQTLLYNLFDMVEHARVPVCIFGCTTKLNILEYLEKRVKSRFSQRIIYMPQIENLKQFRDTILELLTVPNKHEYRCSESWNSFIERELSNEKTELYKLVKTNYDTFRSIAQFKNAIIPLIFSSQSIESLRGSFESCERVKAHNRNQLQTSWTAKVESLSDLELAILICAARTALKTKDETLNFNLVYAEYEEMIKGLNSKIPTIAQTMKANENVPIVFDNAIKLWKKKDVKNIWENLQNLNFLTERGAVGLRESAQAVFYASNYQFLGTTIPFDLRVYQTQIDLKELRRVVPRSSMYYSWTQL